MVAEPMCRVGGLVVAEPMCRLVKSDFISHSGANRANSVTGIKIFQIYENLMKLYFFGLI